MQQEGYIPDLSTMRPEQINRPHYNLSSDIGYKSLHLGHNITNADLTGTMITKNSTTMLPAYMNTGSEGSDPVKYYVLEDSSMVQGNAENLIM